MTDTTIDAIHHYNTLCRQFPKLKQLKISQGFVEGSAEFEQSVVLELTTDHGMSGPTITLRFAGVREFKFTQPDWSVVTLSSIIMVVEPEIEWAPVRVFDAEEDIVRFRCRCVTFLSENG